MPPRFEVTPTRLAGLVRVRRRVIADERGALERLYCRDELGFETPGAAPVQVNLTRTVRRGTVRGLHYQCAPHADAKLVQCLRGRVYDVAVYLRPGSPTFLQWHGEELTPDNRNALRIPAGFAHGFQALEDDCEMLYLHDAPYRPDAEAGLLATDPALRIAWPLPVSHLSARDRAHPGVADAFPGGAA